MDAENKADAYLEEAGPSEAAVEKLAHLMADQKDSSDTLQETMMFVRGE